MAHILGILNNFHLELYKVDNRRWTLEATGDFLVKSCYSLFNWSTVDPFHGLLFGEVKPPLRCHSLCGWLSKVGFSCWITSKKRGYYLPNMLLSLQG